MNINEFTDVLTSFADEPADVDVSLGKVITQIRDDIIDIDIKYSTDGNHQLIVTENEQDYPARSWLTTRVARLPQLADRIVAATVPKPGVEAQSPFVVPSGYLSPDLSVEDGVSKDQPVVDTVRVLLDKASHSLPGATSVLYITSDAGEGKTTVINRAARLQAERYKKKEVDSLIVPISLSGRAFLTFDDAVIAALVNKLRFNYLYFDAFLRLVRMGVIVPAFDGYEEMLVEGSRGEAVSALGNLVQSLESCGTVYVAARKAFFDYLSFRTQARLLDAIGDRSAAFSRLMISRWDREKFCEYGALRKVEGAEDIYETVAARLGMDHPILTRAVLVRRLFDVVENNAKREELVALLGNNPQDYFFTFVDAIVRREASEKWLARVSGDVMEPLLDIDEHHQLLSYMAQEMWQTSSNSLRYEVVDLLVEIFSEGKRKSGGVIRQIKERIKQHSLLVSGESRGGELSFDHEDFQNFYLGEGLGLLLGRRGKTELQAFLLVNPIPLATIEQAVQYLIRHDIELEPVLSVLKDINAMESGFSFSKENCGALIMRIVECFNDGRNNSIELTGMYLPQAILSERRLKRVHFLNCHFQPTCIAGSGFDDVEFKDCEFERIETDKEGGLVNCTFTDCQIDSLVFTPDDAQTFDPALILSALEKAGANVGGERTIEESGEAKGDDDIKIVERFLRVFLRNTYVNEDIVRIRLGKEYAPHFLDHLLPDLQSCGMLEEVPWKGRGVQHRYKLVLPMSEINDALEHARGRYKEFLSIIESKR